MPNRIPRRTLLAGAGLALSVRAARAAATEITVAVSSTSFVLGGVLIGQKAGLFEQQGLAPRITVMDSGSAAMAALLGGSVPFAVTGPSEALAARSRGQDVLIVANLYAGLAGALVLARPVADRLGIAPGAPLADRLRALDNLVIAVPSATSALLLPYKASVEAAKVNVRFTYMAQGAMPAALEHGAIQGMIASFPFAGVPLLRGNGVLWINGPAAELPREVLPSSSSCVMTSAPYLAAHPDMVRQFQHAIMAIAAYIAADKPGAKSALAAAYRQLSPQEIDLAFDQQWKNWTKPFLTPDDMRQELKLLAASTRLPALEHMDPIAALVAPPS